MNQQIKINRPQTLLSPSLLSADFGKFQEAALALADGGADEIHFDIMDGSYVPPITFGADVIKALRPHLTTPFDTHLMVVEPERHIESFVKAGSTIVTFHPEATKHPHRVIGQIKELGARAGVALNPGTPIEAIEWLLPELNRVLIMSVNPGYGGQKFIPTSYKKIRSLRNRIEQLGLFIEISVDGGVSATNVNELVDAGVDVLVSGSSVFSHPNGPSAGVRALREALRITNI
jgi:ribulose-phosphate 3-epimerase